MGTRYDITDCYSLIFPFFLLSFDETLVVVRFTDYISEISTVGH